MSGSAGREHRDADLESEGSVLAPRPVCLLERLDRQVHVPHSIGHLAKAEPGPVRGISPSRRLVGAQRFVEFGEGFGGLSQSQLRRGGVRSEPRGRAVVLQGFTKVALFRRPAARIDRRAGLA